MPRQIPNVFTTFDFSDEDLEMLEKASIPELFQMHLQNLRAQIARDMLALKVDMEKPGVFATNHAYKSGQLDLLNQLLGDSHVASN